MILRDKEIKHEYRVGEAIWELEGLRVGGFEEMIKFVATNFHR